MGAQEAGVRGVGTDISWEVWVGELEAGIFLSGGRESGCEGTVDCICARWGYCRLNEGQVSRMSEGVDPWVPAQCWEAE